MLYIMRRTQLYLDDHLWNALHARAKNEKTTLSELVRKAIRDKYIGDQSERQKAMENFIGIREEHPSSISATKYIRDLRRGSRLNKLHQL